MSTFFIVLATVILSTLGFGFFRILRGPLPTDCMLALLFFGTTGVGALFLLAVGLGDSRIIDVALALALLSAVVGATYVRLGWLTDFREESADD